MPRLVEPVIADPEHLEAQVQCFMEHGYVIFPNLLSPGEVKMLNDAIDRDRKNHPFMWYTTTSRNYNCNLLLTEPCFEMTIRHPKLLPVIERLMGGPICFEELAVRHRDGEKEARDTDWHRDRGYWREHPLHLDYPQVIYYLNDVNETTHCFTLSPEPAGDEILEDKQAHLERGGVLYFYGEAGSAILFNCATLHGVTLRKTDKVRRTIQVYYGHPNRPSLSEVTLTPPYLWRDHPDSEVRRFYSKFNRYTKVMMEGLGLPDQREFKL
jgi:hypothetical protein